MRTTSLSLTNDAPLVTIATKEDEKSLRNKTARFDPSHYTKRDLQTLVRTMRKIMKRAQGIGLSANQVGLDLNFCVVEPPLDATNAKRIFYAIGNPVITKFSKETTADEEGCLSVPGLYGPVPRPEKITVEGIDISGKKLKIKAWGLLARIFQHEIDHLGGGLFIDKATELHKTAESTRLKEKEGSPSS